MEIGVGQIIGGYEVIGVVGRGGMIKAYGPANGFGWNVGEVIGAQIVSVPEALSFRLASAAFRTFNRMHRSLVKAVKMLESE